MSYSWNTPLSLEVKTEERYMRRFETFDRDLGNTYVRRLIAMGYDARLTAVTSGHAICHYNLKVTFRGDDWKRSADFMSVCEIVKS